MILDALKRLRWADFILITCPPVVTGLTAPWYTTALVTATIWVLVFVNCFHQEVDSLQEEYIRMLDGFVEVRGKLIAEVLDANDLLLEVNGELLRKLDEAPK